MIVMDKPTTALADRAEKVFRFVRTVRAGGRSVLATMGFSAWIFALIVHADLSPFLGIVAALATGMALGPCVGALVVTAGLSSLVATLGMNFMAIII
jgi:ribose/xylose/arabinose/galactoside ABC-type transport system permease subunit